MTTCNACCEKPARMPAQEPQYCEQCWRMNSAEIMRRIRGVYYKKAARHSMRILQPQRHEPDYFELVEWRNLAAGDLRARGTFAEVARILDTL